MGIESYTGDNLPYHYDIPDWYQDFLEHFGDGVFPNTRELREVLRTNFLGDADPVA